MKFQVVALVLKVHEPSQGGVEPASEPTASMSTCLRYSSGEPRPKMHDTLATMSTSRRVSSAIVARCRSRSTSSLIEESFSM